MLTIIFILVALVFGLLAVLHGLGEVGGGLIMALAGVRDEKKSQAPTVFFVIAIGFVAAAIWSFFR